MDRLCTQHAICFYLWWLIEIYEQCICIINLSIYILSLYPTYDDKIMLKVADLCTPRPFCI